MKTSQSLASLLATVLLMANASWAEPPRKPIETRTTRGRPGASIPAKAGKTTPAAKPGPSLRTRPLPTSMSGTSTEPAVLGPKLNPTTQRRKLGDVGARTAVILPRFQQITATVRGTGAQLRLVTDRPTQLVLVADLSPIRREDVEHGLRDFGWSETTTGLGRRHDFQLKRLPPGTTIHWLALAKDRDGLAADHQETLRTAKRNVRVTVEAIGGDKVFWDWVGRHDKYRAKWRLGTTETGDAYECARTRSDVGPDGAEDWCHHRERLPSKPFGFVVRDMRSPALELRMDTRVHFDGYFPTSKLAEVNIELPGGQERATLPFEMTSSFGGAGASTFVRGTVEIWHGDAGP